MCQTSAKTGCTYFYRCSLVAMVYVNGFFVTSRTCHFLMKFGNVFRYSLRGSSLSRFFPSGFESFLYSWGKSLWPPPHVSTIFGLRFSSDVVLNALPSNSALRGVFVLLSSLSMVPTTAFSLIQTTCSCSCAALSCQDCSVVRFELRLKREETKLMEKLTRATAWFKYLVRM